MKQTILKRTFSLLALLATLLVALVLGYLIWPPKTVDLNYEYPIVSDQAMSLENYIKKKEASISNIKPGNEAKIIWADSTKSKTEYALVYLHGFSASHEEGGTVHRKIAELFGMNLFLSRLSYHGLEGLDSMKDLTAENLMASALEAVSIGKALGKKVILMGTSTGGTLGISLMAHDPDIFAGIFYSPNIDLADPKTDLLTKPFGLSIARKVLGSNYYSFEANDEIKKFWTTKYPIEATVALQTLLNSTMHEKTFTEVKQPILLISYYASEKDQDQVVSVEAIKECFNQLGTDKKNKKYVELGSVKAHAMCSPLFSKDTKSPLLETTSFLEVIL